MSFDADDMVPYKGNMFSKEVLWHKCKGLGWTKALFGKLEDDQIVKVMDERLTPEKMGISMVVERAIPDLNSTEGSDPSIMGAGGAVAEAIAAAQDKPAPPDAPRSESGVVAVAVVPPSVAGKHLRPIDPTKPQIGLPVPQAPQAPTQLRAAPVDVKPPKTDTGKLMSMLDAAFQLSANDTTISTAKTLVTTNGLERAFQALYPELAKKVLGRIDTTPDAKCRGGTILDIEYEDGYIHIITTAGLITITGSNLVHKGSK